MHITYATIYAGSKYKGMYKKETKFRDWLPLTGEAVNRTRKNYPGDLKCFTPSAIFYCICNIMDASYIIFSGLLCMFITIHEKFSLTKDTALINVSNVFSHSK